MPPANTAVVIENGGVKGVFLEPRPAMVIYAVTLGEPESPGFEPWDRQSVVLYDLQQGTSTNFGPGLLVTFNDDASKLGYNNGGMLWVVDVATGAQTSYATSGGLASLIGAHHTVLPAGEGFLLDLDTNERTPVAAVTDFELRFLAEQRLRPSAQLLDGGLVLSRADFDNAPCADTSEAGRERCRSQAFETWTVKELATGADVLQFRAVAAAPAGPGELVIATSPQCARPDGSTAWCEDVLAELRPSLDRASNEPQYAEGTTNIFIVDVATGEAEYVATAAYRPHPFVWPANWPLIANEDYVVWTEAYCGLPQGKTRLFERTSREIKELDGGVWVRWHGDALGVGEFSSYAILDPATLAYQAAVPRELSGAVWSSDLRYAAVGGVLGHGGLCG